MKAIKYIAFALLFVAGCTGHTADETFLIADKSEIFADGVNSVTFGVDFLGADVTAGSEIMVDGEPLEGNVFTTETAGRYTFTAVYDGIESLPVTITAREAVLTLSSQYRADGDVSHFTIRATYGTVDVSTDEGLVVTNGDGVSLERNAEGFYTVTTEGEEKVTIEATWNGHEASPLVVGQLKFYKRVGIMEFTGTWCTNCPEMESIIKTAVARDPGRSVMVAVHYADALALGYAETLIEMFKASALPAVSLDFGKSIVGTNATSANDMESRINDIVEAADPTCGLAVDVEMVENNAVATVRLLSSVPKNYGLAVMLTEDGVTGYAQNNGGTYEAGYVHGHVLRALWQNNIEGVQVEANGPEVQKTFTFDMTGYNPANCNIVVFATTNDGGLKLVNAVECAVGDSVDFEYE